MTKHPVHTQMTETINAHFQIKLNLKGNLLALRLFPPFAVIFDNQNLSLKNVYRYD